VVGWGCSYEAFADDNNTTKNRLLMEPVNIMVGARGFEPPTSASRTLRSTRLSHAPIELVPEVGVEPT
jgi:hypothetical protein